MDNHSSIKGLRNSGIKLPILVKDDSKLGSGQYKSKYLKSKASIEDASTRRSSRMGSVESIRKPDVLFENPKERAR